MSGFTPCTRWISFVSTDFTSHSRYHFHCSTTTRKPHSYLMDSLQDGDSEIKSDNSNKSPRRVTLTNTFWYKIIWHFLINSMFPNDPIWWQHRFSSTFDQLMASCLTQDWSWKSRLSQCARVPVNRKSNLIGRSVRISPSALWQQNPIDGS